MRLIDITQVIEVIDNLIFECRKSVCYKDEVGLAYLKYVKKLLADAPEMKQLPNEPLTLDELREMIGEPVWLDSWDIGRYDVFCGCTTDGVFQFYKFVLPAEDYGKSWTAYRRKPEDAV